MEPTFDVVGVGCCGADTLGIYEGPILEDEKMQVHQMTRQGGGLVATGLVAVARLGGKARYVGDIGDDDSAQFLFNEFRNEGIDTSCIRRIPGASAIRGICIINPSKGHRTIFYCLDGAPDTDPASMKREDIVAGKVVFVDGFQLKAAIQAAEWGRDAGRMVLMDAELTEPENDVLADLSTHVIASWGFAQNRVGKCDPSEAALRLYDKLAGNDAEKIVGVTAGTQGAYFVSPTGPFHQPSFKVPVVDTTGCGDVFHGAFAWGLARGWDLPKVAKWAAATAALKCRKLGGRAGIPTFEELSKFIEER